MLIEIHVLQNLSPSNPNRDDAGAPKSAYFGGVNRGRISSQCQKRAIRLYPEFQAALAGHLGTRTKLFPELVGDAAQKSKTLADDHARIRQACQSIAKKDDSAATDEGLADGRKRTPQLIYLDLAHVGEFIGRLERLKMEMPKAYEFYLNPSVGFQQMVHDALTKLEADENLVASASKSAWVIAKLRLKSLAKFADESEAVEVPQPSGDPGDELAEWISNRLELLSASDEHNDKKLLVDIFKKPSTEEKRALAATLIDEPNDYAKFQKQLYVPLQSSAVDIALFGRMTTSDAYEDVEANLEVAHAISTNAMVREVDYFTAMDDDPQQKGPGAAHIGENQFASNCFYKYFSLDWNAFVTQLSGGSAKATKEATVLARTAVKELIRAVMHAVPSGKKKGHANNNLPDALLVEIKAKNVPTNYANAFLQPVVNSKDGDLMSESIKRLGHYAGSVGAMYGLPSSKFWLHREEEPLTAVRKSGKEVLAESQLNLDALLDAVLAALPGAK